MSKKGFLLGIAIVATVIWVGALGFDFYTGYQIDRDINSTLERASVASDASDMNQYLRNAKAGMEEWGYTEGHYAWVFVKPYTNASQDYRAINQLIERTDRLEQMNKSSDAYQSGTDDVRGTLRELRVKPHKHWHIHTDVGTAVWLITRFGTLIVLGLWIGVFL